MINEINQMLPEGFVIDENAVNQALPEGFVIDPPAAAPSATPEAAPDAAAPIPEGARPAPPFSGAGPGGSDLTWDQPGYPQVVPTQESESFLGKVGDAAFSRSAFEAAGGLLGGAAGAPAGPPGIVGGSVLGTMGGGVTYDNITNLVSAFENRPEDLVGGEEVLTRMIGAGKADAMWSMGAAIFQPIRLARALLGKMSGVNDEAATALLKEAERNGISLGAVDVGGTLPKSYAKVAGVFPFTGTPLKKGQATKINQAEAKVNEILNTFGPAATMNEIGVDMVQAARGANKKFKSVSSDLYNKLADDIENASRSDIIPSRIIREDGTSGGVSAMADDIIAQAEKGAIILKDGSELPRIDSQETLDFISQLRDIPDLITTDQYRRLQVELSDLFEKRLKDGADVRLLTKVKNSLEESFGNIRTDLLPEVEARAIQDSLKAANTFYSKGIAKFQTKTASAFERVDKAIFSAGASRAGSLNADEITKTVLNLRSPQQIKDLTELVGKEKVSKAASRIFQDAVESARKDIDLSGKTFSVVNPFELEKKLGLAGAGKDKVEGMRELFKTAGVDLDGVRGLINVMKNIQDIGNASDFIKRRVALGGIGALAGAGGVGAATLVGGISGGVFTAGAMTFFTRHMSKIFASGDKLKLMTNALDEAADATLRRVSLSKLIDAISEEDKYE
tara:strand:+ start:774 stop:2810 length:2037 start_codon:yes stop_codon:yes gene_type:complete